MSGAAARPALQQRVAAAILDGAAQIFAVQGEQASMNDIAEAAGVARATVYRYFPNRESLLEALARAAVSDVDARLASARIDEVTPEEGIARAVRALVDVGSPFVLLARDRLRSDPEQFERKLTDPLRRLFGRGEATGDTRGDVTSTRLTESLIGLIVGVIPSTPSLRRDDMSARSRGLFL